MQSGLLLCCRIDPSTVLAAPKQLMRASSRLLSTASLQYSA